MFPEYSQDKSKPAQWLSTICQLPCLSKGIYYILIVCHYFCTPKSFHRMILVLASSPWMAIFDSVAEKRLERRPITRTPSLPISCLPVSLTLTSMLTNPRNYCKETVNQTRYIIYLLVLYSAPLYSILKY